MDVLLTIGEFSKMTYLSVKALRHYHDVGLLEPALDRPGDRLPPLLVDQVTTAQAIRRFRDLEMPIDDVRRVLQAPDDSRPATGRSSPISSGCRRSSIRRSRRWRRCRPCSPASAAPARRRRDPAHPHDAGASRRRPRSASPSAASGSSRRSPRCTRRRRDAALAVDRRQRRAVLRRHLRDRRRRGDGVPARRRRPRPRRRAGRLHDGRAASTRARSASSIRPTERSGRSSPSAGSAVPDRSARSISPRPAPTCAGPSSQEQHHDHDTSTTPTTAARPRRHDADPRLDHVRLHRRARRRPVLVGGARPPVPGRRERGLRRCSPAPRRGASCPCRSRSA